MFSWPVMMSYDLYGGQRLAVALGSLSNWELQIHIQIAFESSRIAKLIMYVEKQE